MKANKIYQLIRLLRPQQWVKNLFVFLPMFFYGQLTDINALKNAVIAFVAFSLVASSVYCFNDLKDVESDKLHEKKRHRPIASGAVSPAEAVVCCIAAFCIGILATSLLPDYASLELAYILIAYTIINLAYCLKLKHIAIIDIVIVAVGFVLRILAGGFATATPISHWIVLLTFLLALFLAVAKRRDDVIIYEQSGAKMRRNIDRYNRQFIDLALGIISTLCMMCYIMYSVSPEVVTRFGTSWLYLTSVFVLAGILRYLQLAIVDIRSGSPTQILLHDRFIQMCILGWLLTFALILYVR